MYKKFITANLVVTSLIGVFVLLTIVLMTELEQERKINSILIHDNAVLVEENIGIKADLEESNRLFNEQAKLINLKHKP